MNCANAGVQFACAHILISSFKFQDEIASILHARHKNPLMLLYDVQ